MGEDNLTYNEYGARQPTSEYEGELPLSLYTNGANVLVTDANGVEIITYHPDFFVDIGVETALDVAKSLKRYYEKPKESIAFQADQLEGRVVYGDSQGEEEIWFSPEEISSASILNEETETEQIQFEVIIDDEAPWPDDAETAPDHEIRIEDSKGNCWYQMDTSECDPSYTEDGLENASELIKNIRLAYEHPREFVRRHK